MRRSRVGLRPTQLKRLESQQASQRRSESDKAYDNRELLGFLAPSLVRIVGLLIITVGFAFWGFNYFSSVTSQSLTASNVILTPPNIYLHATLSTLKAVVTRAVLSPSALSFDLSISAPRNSNGKPSQLTVCIPIADIPNLGSRSSWNTGASLPCAAEQTVNVPRGLSVKHFQLPLTDCSCYDYRPPYLLAVGLGGPYAGSGSPPVFVPYPIGFFAPVIEQDVLDLSSAADLGGGVFALSISPYPSTQQAGPAVWQWQNVQSPESTYFVAQSASAKDVADSRTFQAGLLLGIAGAGIIVVLDHLFDIWREIREYRDQSSEDRKSSSDLQGALCESQRRALNAFGLAYSVVAIQPE